MQLDKCQSDIRIIRDFLDATRNNWRNAAHISCKTCNYEKKQNCGSVLAAIRADGTPVFLPETDAYILFGSQIDISECVLEISNTRFNELYHSWFLAHAKDGFECPYLQIHRC